MSTLYKSILTIPRGIAGIGLLTISIFKLYAILNSGAYFASMLSLCITGYLMMDATNVFLLWMAAFGLIAGVGTRVVALFSLCLVGVQTAICISHLQNDMTMGHNQMHLVVFDLVFLSVLITALMICVVRGGGPFALWACGWHWVAHD
ncbi:MAG: hypothetical protein ABJ364_01830 [Lentilitoribacter sp.]